MRNILIILRKEWLEITQQRNLLMSVVLPPLIFSLLPIALIILTGKVPSAAARLNTVSALPIPSLAGLSTGEFGQALVALQFSVLYLVLPAIIPSVIAAYSIVGEKSNRTLEPLLATPVKTVLPGGGVAVACALNSSGPSVTPISSAAEANRCLKISSETASTDELAGAVNAS